MVEISHNELDGILESSVSLIECSIEKSGHETSTTDLIMRYYIDKILNTSATPLYIYNLSSFNYDYLQFRKIIGKYSLHMTTYEFDLLLDRMKIFQNLKLHNFNLILTDILSTLNRSQNPLHSVNYLFVEDLDEAFNIASFENSISARQLILLITKKIRKLSQLFSFTCVFVSKNDRLNFNIKNVSNMIRQLIDNSIILEDGNRIFVDSIYSQSGNVIDEAIK